MAPISSSSSGKKDGLAARFMGSATAGVLELVIFHPVDTVAKRLMNNKQKAFTPGTPVSQSLVSLNQIIFKNAANEGTLSKYKSLFPGIGFAAGYKILQRIYKFGGQPFVNDYIQKNHKEGFNRAFGDNSKVMIQATAGSLVGIGEIALLPLDVLKIKMQTNPQLLEGRGLVQLVKDEGRGLYRGATWTAARNAPGSFALFGGSAFAKEYIFGLEDYNKATFFQNFVASITGAIASITVSAPLDVVKTRIQAARFDSTEGGFAIVSKMIQKEGMSSFFKGLTPKILVVGPKLIFSFTIAQQMIPIFSQWMDKEKC